MNITYRGTKLETPETRAIVQLDTNEQLHVMCGCNAVWLRYKHGRWVAGYCSSVAVESVTPNEAFRDGESQQNLVENIYGG